MVLEVVIIKKRTTKRKTNSEFVKEVYGLVDNEYEFLEKYKNNSTKILCRHNLCGSEYKITPNNFLQGYRCAWCAGNVKKTDEEFKKEVYGLVKGEYIFLEEYKNNSTKILCKHDLCGHEYKASPNQFLQGNRCPECSSSTKKTSEEFVKEIYDLVDDEYEFLEKYKSARTSILCRHNSCGHEWMVIPSDFLRGTRCPRCAGNIRKTAEEFKKEVFVLVGSEYTFMEGYKNNRTGILCRHNSCGHKYKVTPSNFLRGRRCPVCTSSKGEERVGDYLKNNNISFKVEHSFSDLVGVGSGLLRFDFAVLQDSELAFLIEYDGRFHFEEIFDREDFKRIQIHDERKNQYCKDNNIPLLRIPYWEFDNIEKILEEFIGLADIRPDVF